MRLRSELQSQQKGETSESVLLELRSVKEVNEGLMQRLHEQDSEETSVKMNGVSDEMHTESANEVPAEVPAEQSTQSPSEVPTEIPSEIPAETSILSYAEVPAEIPVKSPTQSPTLLPLATLQPEQSASQKRETPLPPEMPPSKQSLVYSNSPNSQIETTLCLQTILTK